MSEHAGWNTNSRTASSFLSYSPVAHLIKLVPDRVKVLLYNTALESQPSHTDLHVGVTFALHHAPHVAVLSNKILGLQQLDP